MLWNFVVAKWKETRSYGKLVRYVSPSIDQQSQQWPKIKSSLKLLLKRLVKEEKEDQFMKILELREGTNGVNDGTDENGGDDKCIIIKNPSTVDRQSAEGYIHVLSVRVFAHNHHLIRGPHQLKSSEKEPVSYWREIISIIQRVNTYDEQMSPNYELTRQHSIVVKKDENLIECVSGSLDAILEDNSEQQGHKSGVVTVRLESPNQPWMKVTYGRKTKTFGFDVHEREFIMETGKTEVHTPHRLVIPVGTSEARQKIGAGIKLYHSDGKVFIEKRSENPIYVKSYLANLINEKARDTVMEVKSQMTFKVWDDAKFAELFSKSCDRFVNVNRLLNWGTILIGLTEEFGYSKEDGASDAKPHTETGHWLHVTLLHVFPIVFNTGKLLCEETNN